MITQPQQNSMIGVKGAPQAPMHLSNRYLIFTKPDRNYFTEISDDIIFQKRWVFLTKYMPRVNEIDPTLMSCYMEMSMEKFNNNELFLVNNNFFLKKYWGVHLRKVIIFLQAKFPTCPTVKAFTQSLELPPPPPRLSLWSPPSPPRALHTHGRR